MSLITGDEEKELIKDEAEQNLGGVGDESLDSQADGSESREESLRQLDLILRAWIPARLQEHVRKLIVVAAHGSPREMELERALQVIGCRGIHSTQTERRNCQCITCRTIGGPPYQSISVCPTCKHAMHLGEDCPSLICPCTSVEFTGAGPGLPDAESRITG